MNLRGFFPQYLQFNPHPTIRHKRVSYLLGLSKKEIKHDTKLNETIYRYLNTNIFQSQILNTGLNSKLSQLAAMTLYIRLRHQL